MSAGLSDITGPSRGALPPPTGSWWFTRRFAAGRRGGLALLVLCLVVYVPGQRSLPPVDRDESRFAQASRQMAESGQWGGWIVPQIQDRPRLNKPPLIYWAQAASVKVLGDRGRMHEGIWVYRLPSLLAAVATVVLTWRLGLSMFDARAAWLGAALLAASPLFVWEAHQARADQLLVTTVVATQFALWRIWRSASRWTAGEGTVRGPSLRLCILFWVCLALGIMTKGPIAPMIGGLTVLGVSVATRHWAWIARSRPLLGVAIIGAVVGPWVFLVADQVGWTLYLSTIYNETIGRAGAPSEGHWGPPGYYLIVLTVLFWPGTLLTAAAVVNACRRSITLPLHADGASLSDRLRRRTASRTPELFLLAWIVPTWLVFEVVSTKLPHYTMPLYPAISLLSARAVLEFAARGRRRGFGDKLGLLAWYGIGLLLVVALPWCLAHQPDQRVWQAAAVGTVAAITALVLLVIAVRSRLIVRTQVAGILAASIGLVAVIGVLLPRSPQFWLSPRLTTVVDVVDPSAVRPIGLVGYHEDSMIFLTRGRAERLSKEELNAWLSRNPEAIVVVPVGRGTEGLPAGLRQIEVVYGLNYSTGVNLALAIAERSATAPAPQRIETDLP